MMQSSQIIASIFHKFKLVQSTIQPGQTIASLFSTFSKDDAIIKKEFQHSKNDARLGWAELGWVVLALPWLLMWFDGIKNDAIICLDCIIFSTMTQTLGKVERKLA